MAFGDNTRQKSNADASTNNSSDNSSPWLKLPTDKPDETIIRFMDKTEDVYTYWRYYMKVNVGGKQQDRSLVVGRTGPIRSHMEQLGEDHPMFKRPGKRLLSNVLDRKTSQIKILDYGSQLLDKVSVYHLRVRSFADRSPLNIWDFDVLISSTPGKEAKEVKRDVYPHEDQEPLALDLQALLLYDLTTVQRILPDDAQLRILAGEDLIEILRELNWARPVPTVAQS